MHCIHEINDISELDSWRSAWRDLLRVTPQASFFQTLEWLEVYWRHFGRGQRLRVLVVHEADRPVGILPLVVRRERRKVGPIRVLTYPLDDWGSFYGPIGSQPMETLAAGLWHVKQSRSQIDLIDLRWIRDAGQDTAETEQMMLLADFPPRRKVRTETAVIDLTTSWEQYLAARTSKWRNNFRRWQKRLAAVGPVQHIRHRPAGEAAGDADPRWDLYEHCQRLAAASWQGSSHTGTTLSHATIRDYLRDAHQAAARLGCLDVNLLSVAGRVIAFAYNYQFAGHVFGLRIGYDPAMSDVSPGNMMYAMAVEDSFRRGDRLYDLGPGSLDCKRHWLSRIEPVLQYTYYHPYAVRAQLLKWKGRIRDWLSDRGRPSTALSGRLAQDRQAAV